jgi:hypothetical protein
VAASQLQHGLIKRFAVIKDADYADVRHIAMSVEAWSEGN